MLSEGSTSLPATLSGSNKITVPSFPGDCADATATFAGGAQASAPQAFCYKPKVFAMDSDAGLTSGGSTLTLYGIGFGSVTPTVTIGGVTSPSVTQNFAYGTTSVPGIAFGFPTLAVVVPPNPMGDADVTIQTSFGSTTLPHAFHYAQRTDILLPAKAGPQHVLLDCCACTITGGFVTVTAAVAVCESAPEAAVKLMV